MHITARGFFLRAINGRARKFNNMTQLDDLCEKADGEAVRVIEMALRSSRYQSLK
jgi:hypothetical protein